MIIVRDMLVSDCDAIASIHVRGWQTAYQGIMEQSFLDALNVKQRGERWRQNLAAGNCPINLLAEADGKVLAFGGGGHNRTLDVVPEVTGELWALYTDPQCWGSGAGTALFKEFSHRIGHSFCIWVATENKIGRKFYEKMGARLHIASKLEEVGGTAVPHVAYTYQETK